MHIPTTYFGVIIPLHHTLYLQPNQKETAMAISVVEIPSDVVEAVVLSHVVEIAVRVLESVVGDTSIYNVNVATAGGFITGENSTGSTTTVLAIVSM